MWGIHLLPLDDYDGDGLREFVVGAPFSTNDSVEQSRSGLGAHLFFCT